MYVRSSLQDEFREGRPKSVFIPETFAALRQVILQDRHVTYRKIETTLGINGTIQYIQYCMNISLSKKFFLHNLPIAQKKKRLASIGREKYSKNTIAVLRNTSMAL